jgi:hypothetical protein
MASKKQAVAKQAYLLLAAKVMGRGTRKRRGTTMKRSLFALVLAAPMFIAAPLAHAALIHLNATLTGANEVPATPSPATGFATFDLDTTAQTLAGHITFSGLTGITTASHIHCCLPTPFLTGVNVGVATLVPAFPGFPIGVASGIDDFLLPLNLASSYNPAFVTLQGSLATAEASFIAGLLAGETYLNIHTNVFPGGEIRGFVIVVPEPMTTSLFVLGLAAAGFVSLRRRRA